VLGRCRCFKTYIVTGGGIDFVRACSEEIYGIPREQVIGSNQKLGFEVNEDRGEVMKLAELNSFDARRSRRISLCRSVAGRFWRLATRMVIWQCCGTPERAQARAWPCSFITTMLNAKSLTTASSG
jgi:hypothetical protein